MRETVKMKYIKLIQQIVNEKNKKRLTNKNFSLVTSNCTGGIVYHWLGLKFRSPFINLYMTNRDFITALNNFDLFLHTPLMEAEEENVGYPVGVGYGNTKIHFVHYKSFKEANAKWMERCKRIDVNNLYIMLTNWDGDEKILAEFETLPFRNKVIFTHKKYAQYHSAFYLRGLAKRFGKKKVEQVYRTKNIFGQRYIDQFDYIKFFNTK